MTLLDPMVAERVHADALADRWRVWLRDGGFFAETDDPSPEAAALRSLRVRLSELDAAEDVIARASQPIEWLTGEVPTSVRLYMLGVIIGTLLVGKLIWGDQGVLFGVAATPLILGATALVGLAAAAKFEHQRRQLLAEAGVARAERSAQLVAGVRELTLTTFALRSGGVLIVGAPHRTWLSHRLRDLRVARPPVVPPEWDALVGRMNEAKESIDAALRRAGGGEPLLPESLCCDLPALAQAFVAVGGSRGAEGAALAEALERAPRPLVG